jgi:hypothetical protein
LSILKPLTITSVTSTATSATSSSLLSQTEPAPVDILKRGTKCDPSTYPTLKDELQKDKWHCTFTNQARVQNVSDGLSASCLSTFTLTVAKDAFTYVLKNIIENDKVTRALNEEGIDNIISLVKLTDDVVDNLAYHVPDPNSQKLQKLKIGETGLIKSFIHYVHFHEEINPVGND